jgi:hypothetical protein
MIHSSVGGAMQWATRQRRRIKNIIKAHLLDEYDWPKRGIFLIRRLSDEPSSQASEARRAITSPT